MADSFDLKIDEGDLRAEQADRKIDGDAPMVGEPDSENEAVDPTVDEDEPKDDGKARMNDETAQMVGVDDEGADAGALKIDADEAAVDAAVSAPPLTASEEFLVV